MVASMPRKLCDNRDMDGTTWPLTLLLNAALVRKLRESLMCLAYFLTCYPWVLV